ncbi:tetratricopeptide repeat protein [Leptolyngbya sp. FACHB-541]|uniref:tetratricopeptide repeat protein n=1 Tax=Leptolyngbya sp. FACHB-541 TaxID=2692810 RepID=UPI00168222D6|nr:tetratricopeptide repeat protein [Leptolyngbya sp. FACHB-541]MBD1998853.1 tetratricopeptide repeat protein [Leptolyngbya sp. FACHB-541]
MLSVAVFVFVGWIISVCLHEFGHALVAYWGGDISVKDKGYLTLNPLKYTHLSYSLVLPLVFLLIGGIPLPGAAIYIDVKRLRSRAWESAVSFAGPAASVLVTLLLALPFFLGLAPAVPNHWIWEALAFLILLQVAGVFLNLLPIPPLDGYGIIEPWLPANVRSQINGWSRYGIFVVFGLLWFSPEANRAFWQTVETVSTFLGVPMELAWTGYDLFNQWAAAMLVSLIVIGVVVQRVIPKPLQHWQEQGYQRLEQQHYEAAIAAFDQAIRKSPTSAEAWYHRGNALRGLQRYEEAIDAYDHTIQHQPNYQVWYMKGNTLADLGQYEEAIDAYDHAIQHQPDSLNLGSLRGQLLTQLQRHEEALTTYDRLLQFHSDHPHTWIRRGNVLRHLERYEEAIAAYDRAIALHPNEYLPWLNRGLALGQLQRYEEELTAYQTAKELAPDEAAIGYALSQVLFDLSRYEEAIATIDKTIYSNPDLYQSWYLRGLILFHLMQPERALAALDQAIQIQSNDADLWIERSKVLHALEQHEEAIASYNHALHLSSKIEID